MKKISSLLAVSMSAFIMVFVIAADAKAQKNQDRMPSPPGGRGELPRGVTSRPAREGEFNDNGRVGTKGDRWQKDSDGGSPESRKQDRLPPNPNAVKNQNNGVRTATGYGYGPRSTTPKIQDRLQPDRNYNGPVTIYRNGGQVTTPYPNRVGSRSYYDARYIDFMLRNRGLRDPYYTFGSKYYDRYRNEVSRNLTRSGQAFISKVGPSLQRQIEERLQADPIGFARMERSPVAFGRFVTEIHVKAYNENGWANLPLSDQARIIGAIDVRDLLSKAARDAAISLTPGLFGFNPTPPERRQNNPYRGYRYRY